MPVLAAILLAALLHASWNAAFKSRTDPFMAALAVMSGAALVGAAPIALFILREPATRTRLCAAALVTLGAAAVRLP